MALSWPEADRQSMAYMAGTLFLSSLVWAWRHPQATLRLPIIKNLVFLVSVAQIALRHNKESRPYTSQFGLITIGGLLYERDTWVSPMGNHPLTDLTADKSNLGLVVSMVKSHEQHGIGLRLIGAKPPIQPEFWTKRNVIHHSCPMQDLTADVENKKIHAAVEAMHRCVLKQQSIYLHCQAGEGRSFIVLMCYFLIHGEPQLQHDDKAGTHLVHKKFKDYDTALAYIKATRPHVTAGTIRQTKIKAIVADWHDKSAISAPTPAARAAA